MKIAVIGASGNAGSRITAELARRGHAVTAIARHPEKIAAQANVTPTQGDVMNQAGLARLLAEWRGADRDRVLQVVRILPVEAPARDVQERPCARRAGVELDSDVAPAQMHVAGHAVDRPRAREHALARGDSAVA